MNTLLKVENLCVENNGVQILKDISIDLKSNEILGIIGESGSGKSTFLRAVTNMMNENEYITSGKVTFNDMDLTNMKKEEMRKILGKEIGIVFQNPHSSLNPLSKIGKQFIEVMKSHEKISKRECNKRIIELLNKLNLNHAECMLNSYPFEMSGGMNQRLAIALAMVMNPKMLIADEPTSALDVTVQSKVLEELLLLKESFETSMIVVTHSMSVISKIADKVAVMYNGDIVEYGTKEEVLNSPKNPYTKSLLDSVPKLNKRDE